MKRTIILMGQLPIRFYRLAVSPLIGPRCRYEPTCSAYALAALERHGLLKGLWLAAGRILRCHPWSSSCRHDPVPERFAWRDIMGYKRRRS